MSGGLNWRRGKLSAKRSVSLADEADRRRHDAAARWLVRRSAEEKRQRKPKARD